MSPFPPVMGPVTVKRRTGTTPHGTPVWTSHEQPDCAWAPRLSDEDDDMRETVVVGYWLFGPYDANIRSSDRVIIPKITGPDGQPAEWAVDGEPGRWQSPWSQDEVGVQLALKRATG